MKRINRMVPLAGALVATALVSGCSESRSRGAASIAAPREAGAILEGSRIQGRLTRTVRLYGEGSDVRAESSATEPFDARVQSGAAAVQGRGPVVALARVRQAPAGPLVFSDSEGHRHEIVFEAGENGGPPRAVRASLDGRLLSRVEYGWRRSGGGFVLAHRSTTLFRRDGSPGMHEDMTADVNDVASASELRQTLLAFGRRFHAAISPARLEAGTREMILCWTEQFYYAMASMAVSVAWENLTRTPSAPRSWVAMGAAIKLWDGTLDALLACYFG